MPEHFLLTLSDTEVRLAKSASRMATLQQAAIDSANPLPSIAASLAAWSKDGYALKNVQEILIGDVWCRFYIATPPTNASRFGDIVSAASLRFEMLFDEPAADWAIDAAWDATAPFLACAIKKDLITTLAKTGIRGVNAISPQFVWEWNQVHRSIPSQNCWFITLNNRSTIVAIIECGVIRAVHHRRHFQYLSSQRIDEFLQEEAHRLNESVPKHILITGDLAITIELENPKNIDYQIFIPNNDKSHNLKSRNWSTLIRSALYS